MFYRENLSCQEIAEVMQRYPDVLFLVDAHSRRLIVYEYKDGGLEVGAIRNMEFDLLFQEWSKQRRKQRPSVKDMRDAQNRSKGGKRKKKP